MNRQTMDGWYEYEALSEADTVSFASALARLAVPGTTLALDGDLGAGKTRFARAFAEALGVPDNVNSPTFTIVKEYEGGRLPFYHMDVYRISLLEADELGLDEYLYGEGVSLVEWASLIEPLLPEERLEIVIEHAGEQARTIRYRPLGEPYAQWCRTLKLPGGEGESGR